MHSRRGHLNNPDHKWGNKNLVVGGEEIFQEHPLTCHYVKMGETHSAPRDSGTVSVTQGFYFPRSIYFKSEYGRIDSLVKKA